MGFAFYLIVLIFSVVVHEVSHGYVARSLGDDTAERAGRLTLNPIAHLDLFGSVLLPLMLYLSGLPGLAWAKPVPYNPYNLYKDYKYGPLKVGLAGPASNLTLALVFSLLARVMVLAAPVAAGFFGFVAYVNIFLAVFNLIPIPPLDGSKILPLIFPRAARWVAYAGFGSIILVFIFIYFLSGYLAVAAGFLFSLMSGGKVVGATLTAIRQIGF